jgi:hypothetical protein
VARTPTGRVFKAIDRHGKTRKIIEYRGPPERVKLIAPERVEEIPGELSYELDNEGGPVYPPSTAAGEKHWTVRNTQERLTPDGDIP